MSETRKYLSQSTALGLAAFALSAAARFARHLAPGRPAARRPGRSAARFLAAASHELRTPLNAILGFAGLLEKGDLAESEGREYGRYIRESGEHLLRVLDGILDLARIEAGTLALRTQAGIDPHRLCEDCTRLVAAQATSGGLRLALDVAADAPLLVADRTRLLQALLNLLSNAIKFTAAGGEVVLAARRGGDGGAVFEVRDTGVGMTGPEIEAALQPFGPACPGREPRRAGIGLGLPLARCFVELHGGSLSIDSKTGAGTTARIVLPAGCVGPAAAETLDPR